MDDLYQKTETLFAELAVPDEQRQLLLDQLHQQGLTESVLDAAQSVLDQAIAQSAERAKQLEQELVNLEAKAKMEIARIQEQEHQRQLAEIRDLLR